MGFGREDCWRKGLGVGFGGTLMGLHNLKWTNWENKERQVVTVAIV